MQTSRRFPLKIRVEHHLCKLFTSSKDRPFPRSMSPTLRLTNSSLRGTRSGRVFCADAFLAAIFVLAGGGVTAAVQSKHRTAHTRTLSFQSGLLDSQSPLILLLHVLPPSLTRFAALVPPPAPICPRRSWPIVRTRSLGNPKLALKTFKALKAPTS